MIVLLNIISVVFLSYSITTFRVEERQNDDDDTAEIFQFVPDTYESSKSKNYNAVSTWNLTTAESSMKLTVDGGTLTPVGLGRNGLANRSNLWPDGIIPISVEGTYTERELDMLILAMDTVDYWTCIRFVPYTEQSDYIAIISIRYRGCHSDVGYIGGRQEIRLESRKCFDKVGTVLHELLHAIGLIDEHRRPDRDKYLHVHEGNVIPGEKERFKQFTQLPTDDYGIPFDYSSVMHLSKYAYSKNGLTTLEPKMHGYNIGQRDGMSVRDAIKVANMYHCFYELDMTLNYSRILPVANETLFPKDILVVLYYKEKMKRN